MLSFVLIYVYGARYNSCTRIERVGEESKLSIKSKVQLSKGEMVWEQMEPLVYNNTWFKSSHFP